MRRVVLIGLIALAGCSADEVHSPQAFFPGSHHSTWSGCDKLGVAGNEVVVCADLTIDPATSKATAYSILFHLPNAAHVRVAVFDAHAALVKVLLDSDETGHPPGVFRDPPVDWDFTDSAGRRVPRGDYRVYLSAGDFVSSSDVELR